MGNTLEILNTLSSVSLALTVIFLFLSVVTFFYFHIIDIYLDLSGKAKREAIKKKQDDYSVTGTLRQSDRNSGSSSGPLSGSLSGSISSGLSKGTGGFKKADNSSGMFMTEHLSSRELAVSQTGAAKPYENKGQGTTYPGSQAFVISKEIIVIHTNERID